LKDQSGGRSFKFEFDNTLAEDMMAHQGMAAAVMFARTLSVPKNPFIANFDRTQH
jgi:hypothetical protein